MRRKVALAALLALAVCLASCKCAAEKGAVANVVKTHTLVTARYMKYVKADAAARVAAGKMTQAEAAAFVDDEQKLVDSDARNIEALRKSLGD
ncbi:MAG: hypothetical protein PHS14_20480 [Elusimicrobia bacterium]|nr:hypothetical protein [Elusimicrobiota bacterium]